MPVFAAWNQEGCGPSPFSDKFALVLSESGVGGCVLWVGDGSCSWVASPFSDGFALVLSENGDGKAACYVPMRR